MKTCIRVIHLIAMLIIGLFSSSPVFSQRTSIDDVFQTELRDFGAIMDADKTSGYYFFYEMGRAKKKERKFKVALLNQNLEPIGSKSFTGSDFVDLQEGTFNGDVLALKFSDSKEETFTIRLLDKQGEQIGSKRVPYGMWDDPQSKTSGASATGMGEQTIFPIPGKGFVNYSIDTRKGRLSPSYYTIQFIPNDNDREKAWSVNSPKENDEFEMASFLAADDKVLISTILKRKGLMSRDFEYFVLGTDLATGEELFEQSIEDDQYAMMVTNAWMHDGAIRYFGQYFDKDAKTVKAGSLGLCTFTMSLDGTIHDRHYVSWASDVSKLLPANAKGKIEDVGYLFFHDFITTPTGTIFGIAENYRKVISATGVAFKILSRGQNDVGVSSVMVEDLYLVEFNPDFELKHIEIVEKSQHEVLLPNGALHLSPQLLSYLVLHDGGFDYLFTQKKEDLFSVGYIDLEKRKGEKNRLIYGTANYLDGELSTDKIELGSSADALRALPAKPGYVAIWEYFAKEKKMDIRLERVNF